MATALEQLACENPGENPIMASVLAPIRSLFGISKHETLFLYAWVLIIVIYLILYYVVPLSIVNSENGFISGRRVFLSTLVVFFLAVTAYAIWYRQRACDIKLKKAEYYVIGRKPSLPPYLGQAVKRVSGQPEAQEPGPTGGSLASQLLAAQLLAGLQPSSAVDTGPRVPTQWSPQ